MKAYVLIHVRTGSINEVIRNLKRSSDILEANMTFGPYDIVAVVKATDVNHLGHLIATEIQPIPGVLDTLTCLIVEP
ncbi:MAG TPA: Lrp/AsnC ligand binding domain-containing protein [Anaerolineales bacterium]|nr:Lrp/AsnC ligand binding domain-containing protein [Anaerolineales bacterium]